MRLARELRTALDQRFAVAAELTQGVDAGDAASLLQAMLTNLTDQDAH